jgi:phenylalanyl-tRNA synthetase alpha chain
VPIPQVSGGDLPQEILNLLGEKETFTTSEAFPDIPQRQIKAAIDRLGSRSMVEYDTKDTELVLLTTEGKMICDEGSHEYKVWDAVRRKGKLSIKELPVCFCTSKYYLWSLMADPLMRRKKSALILQKLVKAMLSATSGSRKTATLWY